MRILKNIVTLMFTLILINSCVENKSHSREKSTNDSWAQVSKSTNHFDYSNYIIENPESEYIDSAIARYIYFENLNFSEDWVMPDCFGNCINIRFNRQGEMQFNFSSLRVDSLRIKSLAYLIDKHNNPEHPEKKQITDFLGMKRVVSKGYFEVVFVKDSCPELIPVVKEISRTISDYRDFLTNDWYNTNYSELEGDAKDFMDSLFSRKIIFIQQEKFRLPPPPPSPKR